MSYFTVGSYIALGILFVTLFIPAGWCLYDMGLYYMRGGVMDNYKAPAFLIVLWRQFATFDGNVYIPIILMGSAFTIVAYPIVIPAGIIFGILHYIRNKNLQKEKHHEN